MPKKSSKQKVTEKKEWPAAVYLWAFGLGILVYMIFETVFRQTTPHPIHWISGLIGGILGIGAGWLWYRWRGDVF